MKMTSHSLRLCALALGIAAAWQPSAQAADTTTKAAPVAAAAAPVRDVVAANIDASVSPGDDFFEFANGAWLKTNPIPAQESMWGIGQVVQDDLYVKLRKISETAAAQKHAASGSDEQKVEIGRAHV